MKRTTIAVILLILPTTALANVVWPALYVETKASSIPIIGLSLAFEYLAICWLFRRGIGRSMRYTINVELRTIACTVFLTRGGFGIR
jgi:hypothetical protein